MIKYDGDLDEFISKFPKVIEDVKFGKIKSINQIVGSIVKGDMTIDAKDLYDKIYLKLLGNSPPEKIAKEVIKDINLIKIESVNEFYKINNDFYCKTLYKIENELVNLNNLTNLQLNNPNIIKVKQILDNLVIKT